MSNGDILEGIILENILEKFCEECPAWVRELGSYYCPYGEDPTDGECIRNGEWRDIEHETKKFIASISSDWPSSR